MALSQQKFREMVFQILYSQDIGQADPQCMLELMMHELSISKKNVRMAQERVQKIQEKLPEIDYLISSVSTSYDFNRIQTVAKNILRLGVFELLFDDKIPPKVAITEAIRLARKFGTPESASFVNALLDHLYKASLGQENDLEGLERHAQLLDHSEQNDAQKAIEARKKEGQDQDTSNQED